MAVERIGRYRILQEIAAGAQGTVYRGFDPEGGRLVAVKVLHPTLTGDATYVERFHREASLAASIDHPNVIRIFEVGEDAGRHFMALEFLPESLSRLIESGGLPPERAAAVAAEIGDGLGAAHARGIVHRDMKPQNVLVTPEGTPKVTDFGIARAESMSTMTATGMMMGTPYYMSPEQARGERADARSDVYSLGCVVYQMLTGQVPFDAPTPLAVLRHHTDSQPRPVRELRSDVPRSLADVVRRSMERDPARRYANASEMAEAVRSAMPGLAPAAAVISIPSIPVIPRPAAPPPPPPPPRLPTVTPPAPLPARPRPRWGRRFAWAFGTLALIAAVVLIVGLLATGPLRPTPPAPPASKPPPAPTAAPAEPQPVSTAQAWPAGTVLFEDTFAGGTMRKEWGLMPARDAAPDAGWGLLWDEGFYQLVGKGHAHAAPGGLSVMDVRVEARIRLDRGAAQLNFRQGEGGRYSIALPDMALVARRVTPVGTWQDKFLAGKSLGMEHGRWYDLRVVAVGRRIEVYLDGELAAKYDDPDPFHEGRIDFECHADSVFRLSGVRILSAAGPIVAVVPAPEPSTGDFKDTFEGGALRPEWRIGAPPDSPSPGGWDVVQEEGVHQLLLKEHVSAGISGYAWSGSKFKAVVRLRLNGGSGHLNLRTSDWGYSVRFPQLDLITDRLPSGQAAAEPYVVAKSEGPQIDYGRWHELTVAVTGHVIEVYLDGKPAIKYALPDELPGFRLDFESHPKSDLRLQSVAVSGAPAAAPTPAPEPRFVLFKDAFAGGVLQAGWSLLIAEDAAPGSKWDIAFIEGAYQLVGKGHAGALFGEDSWTDYQIQTRVRLDGGKGRLNFRITDKGRYDVSLPELVLGTDRLAPDGSGWRYSGLAKSGLPRLEHGRWYEIWVAVAGARIQVYIDGKLALEYTDPDPLPRGAVEFESLADSLMRVQWVSILGGKELFWEPAPTPRPAPTPAPTPTPAPLAAEVPKVLAPPPPAARFPRSGAYYAVVPVQGGVRWDQARTLAREMSVEGVQGHLATLTADEENEWVRRLMEAAGIGNAWLGGVQAVPNAGPGADWKWVTGEPWRYTNWAPGEPNDDGGEEMYLELLSSGAWNDISSTTLPAFVVEFPLRAVPEPAYGIAARIATVYSGPGSLPAEQRSPHVTLVYESAGPTGLDSAWVALPDGRSVTLSRFAGIFAPDVDWVSKFRFSGTLEGMPPLGHYTFVGQDARGGAIPGASVAVDREKKEPPPPPFNLRATLAGGGLEVKWDFPETWVGAVVASATPRTFTVVVQPVESTADGAQPAVYGARELRDLSHLIPQSRPGFGPNDYGAPIDEWRDGTYRLSVRVVVEDWSKPGASVSVSNDPAEDLFLSVRNGAIAAVSRSAAAPGYEIHADVVAAYDGPASLPPHQRNVSGRFFMAGRGPQMPDAVRVTLPDGTVRMLPRYTDVFSPGTDWVTQFRFGASFPERPWPGKYVFAGLDAAGVPIPGIEAAVSVAGSRPPDPPAGVSVWASPEGLMVTWQPVPVVPGTFDPDRGIGFYQLTVLQPEAAIMVYGAGQMRGTSHLVPRTRGEFSPNSLGSPIQEWPDGTYHLFVVANAEENEGSLVSSEDSRRNVVLTVQGGAVVRVEGAAASTSTSTPRRINVLSDAFEGGAAGVWSDRTTDASNRDQFTEFLGRFTNDTVSLTLQNLPPHDLVELTFDLYVIDSWDGSNYRSGPDYFQVGSGGSRDNLFSETFHSGCPGEGMSYAATRPESCGPDLGFNPIYGDSIYRNLNNGFTFGHTGSTLVINFSGSGLQDVEDESWGIDNVRITLVSGP